MENKNANLLKMESVSVEKNKINLLSPHFQRTGGLRINESYAILFRNRTTSIPPAKLVINFNIFDAAR
jgi:hypothetical protein